MIHWRKLLVLALVGSFFYCPLHDLAQAAPGDLDRVFGTETIVSTNFFDGGGLIQAVTVLADEKIVAAGSAATSNQGFNVDFALARYHSDGSLDTSFGTGGKQTTEFSGFQDTGTGMAIQPDGKIILAGTSRSADGADNSDFALARYNPNGGLDSTFGAGGKVTTDIMGLFDHASAVALQPDGKIIAAGQSVSSAVTGALVRYNQDGSLDSGFGTGGKLLVPSAQNLNTIAIQPDGKIVAAGSSGSTSPTINDDFAVLRYNPDGSLDTAFGNNGKTVTDFSGLNDFVNSCALSPDGKIILAGRATRAGPIFDGDYDFGLARYNENGSLDPTFGNGGKVVTDFSSIRDGAARITLQPDGKIVAVGEYLDAAPSFRLSLARYNLDGSLDSTFGAAGKVATSLAGVGAPTITVTKGGNGKIVVGGAGGFTLVRFNPDGSRDTDFHSRGTTTTDFFNRADQANAVAVQDDGKIIAAGVVQNQNGAPMFALARYNLDGNLDSSFGVGGKVTDRFGDIIFALLVQPDGRIIAGGKSSSGKFGLMRFNADGSPDETFAGDGKVATEMLEIDEIRALALQPDGRIIAVGTGRTRTFFGVDSRIVIARYKKDGSLDPSFGEEGKVIPFRVDGVIDIACATGLQSDGKIVVAGSTQKTNSPTRPKSIVVARYNSDGSLDASFGNAGRVTNAGTGFASEARALAIQPDDKIVVAGYDLSGSRAEDFALLRYDQDGDLDAGFGTGGIVITDFFGRSDIINGLALAADGRIIAAGSSDNRTRDFALAIYKADGGLDQGFGINGKVTTKIGTDDTGNALALGPDGSIFVAGSASFFDINRGEDFAVARYEGFPGGASPAYDLCLQDETTGNVLKLNSQTGDYQFTTCGVQSIMLAGKAKLKLKKAGCLIKLNKDLSDHKVTASINTCRKSGSASVSIAATGQTFIITDNDTRDNPCACP